MTINTLTIAINSESIDEIASTFCDITGMSLVKRYGDNYGGTYYIHEDEGSYVAIQKNYSHYDDDYNFEKYKNYVYILEIRLYTTAMNLLWVRKSLEDKYGARCKSIQ